MEVRSVETIVRRLNEAGVRYIIVGGVAVVAHGYVRFTADLDLMLDLEDEANVRRALEALKAEGYAPRAPVPIEQFADAALRRQWIEEKNLTVFSLWSDLHARTELDVFVKNPLDFSLAFARAPLKKVAGELAARVASREDLLDLKRQASRPQDLIDIDYLERLPPELHDTDF